MKLLEPEYTGGLTKEERLTEETLVLGVTTSTFTNTSTESYIVTQELISTMGNMETDLQLLQRNPLINGSSLEVS